MIAGSVRMMKLVISGCRWRYRMANTRRDPKPCMLPQIVQQRAMQSIDALATEGGEGWS